jgi:N-acetylglutamate synthase/N-acetylornithine aminotransferase
MSKDNDLLQTCELRVTGVGYLDNIVELKSNAGVPFLACDIIAFTDGHGSGASRRIEVTVLGAEAEAAVRRCKREVSAGNAVMVAFCLSDIWGKVVSFKRGPKAGTLEACLKARLVSVTLFSRDQGWIADDGTDSSWEQENDE